MALIFWGCAGQLAIKEITADPNEVTAGKQATLMVIFTGPKKKVASVTATVREAPEVYYRLNNDGKNGDEEAGDNIWTCNAIVPYEAMPGTYNLDISAKDTEGNILFMEKVDKKKKGRRGILKVKVE